MELEVKLEILYISFDNILINKILIQTAVV